MHDIANTHIHMSPKQLSLFLTCHPVSWTLNHLFGFMSLSECWHPYSWSCLLPLPLSLQWSQSFPTVSLVNIMLTLTFIMVCFSFLHSIHIPWTYWLTILLQSEFPLLPLRMFRNCFISILVVLSSFCSLFFHRFLSTIHQWKLSSNSLLCYSTLSIHPSS